jgi:hypothetical protein
MGVFHHQILVEESQGLLQGSGSHAYQEGIKVLQNLPPEFVDGPVALIDYYEVEVFNGNSKGNGSLICGISPGIPLRYLSVCPSASVKILPSGFASIAPTAIRSTKRR